MQVLALAGAASDSIVFKDAVKLPWVQNFPWTTPISRRFLCCALYRLSVVVVVLNSPTREPPSTTFLQLGIVCDGYVYDIPLTPFAPKSISYSIGKLSYEALTIALQRPKRASAVDTLRTVPRTPKAKVNEYNLNNYVEDHCRLYKDLTALSYRRGTEQDEQVQIHSCLAGSIALIFLWG
ncbi:hypothetical protein K443DRAFT_8573 [Laccaria amethystina LaAM-08-1]|uniref:Uncharacterized protein n=1 Tax=Laccaria amethystina LaAM-08-1 TaxID=1095629 RepID=A0A0C9XCE7_9AGAR|nr:hypothetical protein K443DRAFT_8573 [Laccaria amethystina LaAM-08-1]